jgi:hypothetical protein
MFTYRVLVIYFLANRFFALYLPCLSLSAWFAILCIYSRTRVVCAVFRCFYYMLCVARVVSTVSLFNTVLFVVLMCKNFL